MSFSARPLLVAPKVVATSGTISCKHHIIMPQAARKRSLLRGIFHDIPSRGSTEAQQHCVVTGSVSLARTFPFPAFYLAPRPLARATFVEIRDGQYHLSLRRARTRRGRTSACSAVAPKVDHFLFLLCLRSKASVETAWGTLPYQLSFFQVEDEAEGTNYELC